MASDLRDEIARTLRDTALNDHDARGLTPYDILADAVLRVVGERLLSDEAMKAGSSNQRRCSDTLSRNVLSAAWRVVTGSNYE